MYQYNDTHICIIENIVTKMIKKKKLYNVIETLWSILILKLN